MNQEGYSIAVVGATGAVGEEILHVLERREFPVREIRLLASARSAGKTLMFHDETVVVEEVTKDSFEGVDIAFFSAGATRSREFAPAAIEAGAFVIDNSSAFRMQEDIPLVIPEVNPEDLDASGKLIANPNCCAAILCVSLAPLHKEANIKRIIVSTYQSASGAGAQAMKELENQCKAIANGEEPVVEVFPFQAAFNVLSHNSPIQENDYNEEENKLAEETRKIFHAPDMSIISTCIRVPVLRAHSEAIVIETEKPLSPERANELLANAPGLKIVDDPETRHFPMPIEASGDLDVHVGRVRRADGDKSLALFVSGDQLLKGAAWNAVQIGEVLIERGLIKSQTAGV